MPGPACAPESQRAVSVLANSRVRMLAVLNAVQLVLYIALLAVGLVAPAVIYPIFLMKALCFALFASAFWPCANWNWFPGSFITLDGFASSP